MAKVIKVGAGKARVAGTTRSSLQKQRPNNSKPSKTTTPAARTLRGTVAGGGPSSSKASTRPQVSTVNAGNHSTPTPSSVKDQMIADQRQANYMGGVPKRILQAAEAAVRQKYSGGNTSSHALVRPPLPVMSRTGNLRTFAQKASANTGQGVVDSRVFTKPADKIGSTSSSGRRSTKTTTIKAKSSGPKITYQKRAAKGVGKKPYILSA